MRRRWWMQRHPCSGHGKGVCWRKTPGRADAADSARTVCLRITRRCTANWKNQGKVERGTLSDCRAEVDGAFLQVSEGNFWIVCLYATTTGTSWVLQMPRGAGPLWPYAPKARYLPNKGCWHIRQNLVEFLCRNHPLWSFFSSCAGICWREAPPVRDCVCLTLARAHPECSVCSAPACGVRKVLFAEADPRALELVRLNIALNKFSRTECVRAAICGQSGLVGFRQDPDINASMLCREMESAGTNGKVVEVEALRLTDLFGRLQPDPAKPVLCKMDIEGAEVELISDIADLVPYVSQKRLCRSILSSGSWRRERGCSGKRTA